MNDEIITEVRAIKDAIGAKFNYPIFVTSTDNYSLIQ
jgi:hypothetical protein